MYACSQTPSKPLSCNGLREKKNNFWCSQQIWTRCHPKLSALPVAQGSWSSRCGFGTVLFGGVCFLFSLWMTFTCTPPPMKIDTCKLVAVFIKNYRKLSYSTVCKRTFVEFRKYTKYKFQAWGCFELFLLTFFVNCFYSHF